MVIGEFKIPLYGKFIVLSMLCNLIFNYWYLKKEGVAKRIIWLSILMVSIFCIMGAKIMTLLTSNDSHMTLFNAGLSSYGGAIGIIVSSVIFFKLSNETIVIKSNILSLPLMYSIAKLGCFFGGCCYGIPYDGIFSVRYLSVLNMPLFPVQLLESIIFMMIFIFCCVMRNRKNIIELLIIISALAKFCLDFSRYSHIDIFLSVNQVISLIIFFCCLIYFLYKKNLISK